jgi:hypothetical protein
MRYQIVTEIDFEDWLELACLLWPEHAPDDLRKIFREILLSEKEDGVIVRNEETFPVKGSSLRLTFD